MLHLRADVRITQFPTTSTEKNKLRQTGSRFFLYITKNPKKKKKSATTAKKKEIKTKNRIIAQYKKVTTKFLPSQRKTLI